MSELVSTGLVGLAAALALVTSVWVLSLIRRDASVIDIFWGAGFALLAWVYFTTSDGWETRKSIAAGLTTLWGLRLSLHILWRSRGKGEDYRYREMREQHGASFWWVSLFTVFLLQGLLMWVISAPLLQAQLSQQPARLTWIDLLGLGVFAVGLTFETVGDLQLVRFRANPANEGKVLRSGLWRYTRHPNYFGDSMVWWGLFLLALATPGSIWTIYSPLLMTLLLLKVSGVGLLEKKLKRTRPEYADYVASTSAFFPWFPAKTPSGASRSNG